MRIENYAPQSYLGASLFELKDCSALLPVLKSAESENPPGAVRTKLQNGRAQCGGSAK
jgi:hypothetical protein